MKVRIGCKGGPLATAQSRSVMEQICRIAPEVEVELVDVCAEDADDNKTMEEVAENGLFVKELDKALLDGRIDMAVHSLEELPTAQDPRLPIAAFLSREDPREVMVLRKGLEKFPFKGGVIGTSCQRRRAQIAQFYPTAELKPIRGSILTAVAALDCGEYDGLLLSAADLKYLGLEERMSRVFNVDQLIPAAGQGILAVQCRYDADLPFIQNLGDKKATACAVAERAFVRTLGGGIGEARAAYAQITETGVLKMVGYYVTPQGEDKRAAIAGRPVRAGEMGERLARQLRGDAQ